MVAAFLCFAVHWSFIIFQQLPIFRRGSFDLFLQKLGMNYHYTNISQGLIETKGYCLLFICNWFVLFVTKLKIDQRKDEFLKNNIQVIFGSWHLDSCQCDYFLF